MLVDVLAQIRSASGTNEKAATLKANSGNSLLRVVLRMGHDPFEPYHVVKIPKTTQREPLVLEADRWQAFFDAAAACATRKVTGNAAIAKLQAAFSLATPEEEVEMRKVLDKHMALGASTKTINKVIPGLIPTFEVALAQKFEEKRLAGRTEVAVEPKLDGIRCFAVVENGHATIFARSGKLITNFDTTIGADLASLGDGCYDGEIMGQDFTDLMRQAYRKENTDVSRAYLALFDFLPLSEWKSKAPVLSTRQRYDALTVRLKAASVKHVQLVDRSYVAPDMKLINALHDKYAAAGYEGAMVKDVNAQYRFGRGWEVMKLKAFSDVDLPIASLIEGTGKHEGKLGSVVVNFNGVDVQVGSGWSDELRDQVWADPDAFIGRMIEVRYQEVTPDGSLRFPTFKCFRNDRDE